MAMRAAPSATDPIKRSVVSAAALLATKYQTAIHAASPPLAPRRRSVLSVIEVPRRLSQTHGGRMLKLESLSSIGAQ